MTDSTPIPQESTQEHEQEDRLSKLPDDVLILILDKLKLLSDAVRTCVLSKRWRHLVGLLSEIVLDVAHYQPRDVPSSYTLQELVQANVSVHYGGALFLLPSRAEQPPPTVRRRRRRGEVDGVAVVQVEVAHIPLRPMPLQGAATPLPFFFVSYCKPKHWILLLYDVVALFCAVLFKEGIQVDLQLQRLFRHKCNCNDLWRSQIFIVMILFLVSRERHVVLDNPREHGADACGDFILEKTVMDESIDIVHSVDSAMAGRGVDRAEFKIISEMGDESCTHHDKITYGRRFLTFLDSYPRAFGGLTDLIIYNLRLGVSDIPNVLGTCKKLEYLYLQNCDAGIRSVIQIEHSQLAELVIVACPFERIELKWLPQLTHLTCQTWLPSRDSSCPLSFGYVPQLWALILTNMASTFHHNNVKLSELLRNSVIRKLELDFQSKKIYIQPEGPKRLAPLLKNLETVILRFVHEDWHLTWTMFFLEAAPLLKEINIHVWGHDCNSNEGAMYKLLFQKTSDDHLIWEARNDFKHYNLSKLIIEGYQVEEKFTRYIRQVMESAVNLVLLSLLQSRLCANCGFCPSTAYPQTDQERERIKMQISEWRSSPIKIEFGI
ncbi:hypothetical protein EJB05_39027 [Eragrostis curvula]|uniref:F-box domain-containing protein n=1 Tax=Eragrostis curvula TaxID=38414 RepID=A0A5J9TVR6_9POAL|nr:hypothetical protein EJB05_39027 [Eragrostis curvula]